MEFLKKTTDIDFLAKKKTCLIISLALIAVGLIFYVARGGFNYGIDFVGGTMLRVSFGENVSDGAIREAVTRLEVGEVVVQGIKNSPEHFIRIEASSSDLVGLGEKVMAHLTEALPGSTPHLEEITMIGPKIGSEMRAKAVGAAVLAMILIVIYITLRFQFVFAIAALLALAHDVLITLGAFAVTDKEVSLPIVAAILTIIGYSLNDTIVVFDRIRENLTLKRGMPFTDLINLSVNQTLSRTLLTSGTTLLVVLALFFLAGPGIIHDFSFALIVGVVTGTYSSIFVASPLLVIWKPKTLRVKTPRRR